MTVELVAWNPERPIFRGRAKRLVPVKRPVNNFGDLLGPVIVDRMRKMANLPNEASRTARLLSVGSILHFARDGDVVWGSGVNGKIPASSHSYSFLDVRAVRGPLTRDFLRDRGIEVPEIFGDPALLLPHVAPELLDAAQHKKHKVTIVPNFQDLRLHQLSSRLRPNLLNPSSGLWRCLYRIVQSELVVGSSLHAIIVAEAFGIPARAVQSEVEHDFKYLDYYTGTGRKSFEPAPTVRDAIKAGGEPSPVSSVQPLLNAFPSDLWK
jgi:pyruvyltransferase